MPPAPAKQRLAAATPAVSAADTPFDDLSARWLDGAMRLSPVFATQTGDHRFDARTRRPQRRGPRQEPGVFQVAARRTGKDRSQHAVAREPGRCLGPAQPAALRHLEFREPAVLGLGPDGLQPARRRRAVRADGARIRADARPPAQRHARAWKNSGAVRADARQPRPGARAADPRRDGRQAEQGRAQPDRRTDPAARRRTCRKPTASAWTRRSPGLRTAVDEHQAWLDKTLVPNAKGDFRIGQKLYDEKLAFALDSPLSRAEIRKRAEAELARVRSEMYTVARGVLAGKQGAPETPEAPSASQQQAAIQAALELAYADRPTRDKVVETAKTTLASATEFVREKDLITLPDSPGEDHPDAGVPARRGGRLLRLARPARQVAGHLLRGLADSGRLDREADHVLPARVQHAIDRRAEHPRGDARPLRADLALEQVSVGAARRAVVGLVRRRLGGLRREGDGRRRAIATTTRCIT